MTLVYCVTIIPVLKFEAYGSCMNFSIRRRKAIKASKGERPHQDVCRHESCLDTVGFGASLRSTLLRGKRGTSHLPQIEGCWLKVGFPLLIDNAMVKSLLRDRAKPFFFGKQFLQTGLAIEKLANH